MGGGTICDYELMDYHELDTTTVLIFHHNHQNVVPEEYVIK